MKIIDYIKRNRQQLFNIYLFVNVAGWVMYQTYKTYKEGRLDYIEISFALQNIIMMTFILIRKRHSGLDPKIFNQMVAAAAFFSGAAFIGQPVTGSGAALVVSRGVIFVSNVLGVVTLLNLGRSFGILIAFREIKTGGLYSIVRHPMYGTDILLRIGFIISHFNLFTVMALILSTGCYVYRAVLEERYLSRQEEYREYKKRVRYRFLPYIF
ncbi:MAG: isoprenylcysteine carboxylmethyltransferase family protein [bacterium]|nr:isoprenylcysteine carboxylmethyltransferase family protein [bacterium]